VFTRIQLVIVPLLLASVAWCQEPQTGDQQNTTPEQQPESQVTAVIQNVPGPVSGINPPLAVAGERASTNVIVGSFGFGTYYDDNMLNNNTNPFYDFLYTITPSIGFQQTRPRVQWSANYTGGVSVDQRLDNRNIISQAATGNFAMAITQHVVLQLRETYATTSDPFFDAGQSLFVPAPSGPGALNPFPAVPPSTSTSNISTADITWEVGPHTLLGASGSYSTLNYSDVVTASGPVPQLIDTRSVTGRAYLAHQVSRRQSLGVEFDVQDLRFSGLGRTTTYGVFAFTEVVLRQGMKLSVYAGPQYSQTHDSLVLNPLGPPIVIPIVRNQWSPVVGGTFDWEGVRAALRLGAQTSITDGGGVQGAIRQDNATGELRWYLTPRWILTAEGAFYDGRGLVEDASGHPFSTIRTVYGGAGIERKLTPKLSFRLRYLRLHQSQSGTILIPVLADHDRVEFGFTYTFTHPWGG
jgi:hypothetical protein